jgi:hypothetical protein
VLGAGHGREEDGSRAGPRPAREQIVFASREQLMSGDWTVQRVPSLPPSLREKQEVCSARSHTYELPLQFSCGASPPAVKAGAGYAADVATTLENE